MFEISQEVPSLIVLNVEQVLIKNTKNNPLFITIWQQGKDQTVEQAAQRARLEAPDTPKSSTNMSCGLNHLCFGGILRWQR